MEDDKTLLKVNPLPDKVTEFTQTSSISRKVVLDTISVRRSAFLDVQCPNIESISVALDDEDSSIGRSSDCRIQLQLPNISRVHAKIIFRDEEYMIIDMDSTNGTLLNGVRIHKCILRNNDQIQIGDAKIIFFEERAKTE